MKNSFDHPCHFLGHKIRPRRLQIQAAKTAGTGSPEGPPGRLSAIHRNYRALERNVLAGRRAGEEDRPKEIFTEAGLWNFNSVGFALMRKDALRRAGIL